MKKHTSILIATLGVLLLIVPFQKAFSQIEDDVVVIRPQEIDEVLSNPGMGFIQSELSLYYHRLLADLLEIYGT